MDTNRGRYGRAIDLRQLGRLPILPGAIRDGVINALDSTNVLRNHLRGLLALDRIQRHKNKIDETYSGTVSKLRNAEWTLIQNHAQILINKDQLLDALPMPYLNNYDVPPKLVKDYNLLTLSPILNFLRNEREGGPLETCEDDTCDHLYGLREIVLKKLTFKEKQQQIFRSLECKKKGPSIAYEVREVTKDIIMQVLPEEVVFENYEVGNTYVVKIMLKNCGSNSALLRFVRPHDPAFEISFPKKYNLLAPGLSINLSVSFSCTDKDDHIDRLMVQPGSGYILTIPIKATQSPPLLCSILPYSNLKSEESPLSSTINCGYCYVGTVNIVLVRICNTGSTGRFFIMSEASWYFNKIKDSTLENVLVQKPFYIQPMYFTLGRNRKRKLRVIYSPKWEGSDLARVFILCDNITLRSVDIMGEAVMFDPELFTIEGLEKVHNIATDGDDSAQYFLHLGRVLSYSSKQRTFDVANKSIVETTFAWEVSRSSIPGVNYLQPEFSSITPTVGSLCPEMKIMFTVAFHSQDLPVGKYAAIFTIYLDCIPKAAMMKKHSMWEKEDITELMVRVCLGKIEVWVEIEPVNVCIWPNYIYFHNTPNVWNHRKIYITNYENISITVVWQNPYIKNLILSPPVVDLAPFSSTYVYVCLQAEVAGKIIKTLSAFLDQSLCRYDVLLECETSISLSSGMSEIKDFGILRKGELKKGTIHATVQTNHEVELELRHIAMLYDKDTQQSYFDWIEPSKSVVHCPNSLTPDNPSEVIIKARTEEEQICVDLFEWTFCNTQAYTTIISDVQDLDVSLSPMILDIQEPIFAGEKVSYLIKIINHRHLMTFFRWKSFFGDEIDSFEVTAQPDHGPLPPDSEIEINLTILPLEECIFQNLYYCISIKNMEKPLIGLIRGFVRGSLVAFSWINEGKEISLKWPQEECDPEHRQYPSIEPSISELSSDKDCEICFSEHFTSSSSFKSVSTGEKMEADIMAFDDPSETKLIPYDNWPYIGGKYFGAVFTDPELQKDFETPWTDESLTANLKSWNKEDVDRFFTQFSEKSMNFTVETFKVHTQILYISNLSPVPVQYKVKTNFFQSQKKLPEMDPFLLGEMIFHDQGLCYDDLPTLKKYYWSHRVRDKLGLAIRVKPKCGMIPADKLQAVTVSVFTKAWGIYFDNISIFIDEHPTFHLPVMVKCEYPPAFFTFAPDSISPLLRFPSIRPNRTRWKEVFLENTCPFSLKIVWTVYVDRKPKWDRKYCLPLEKDPYFSLALELHSKKESDFCKLTIMPYVGVQENLVYIIEPSVLYIPPNSKAPLLITVNSKTMSTDIAERQGTLTATALGVVYIDDENWSNEEYYGCYRPDGFGTNPISLKMLTVVEELNFHVINNSLRDLVFKVNTSEIFNTDSVHTSTKIFHIQNNCNSPIKISVRIQEPFQITSIETRNEVLSDITQEFVVENAQTIKVEIMLLLNKSILTKSTPAKPSYLNQEGPIISELNFGHKGEVENIIKLELHLLKPVFKFASNKINFGQACVMQSAIEIIDVHVKNGDQPFKVRIDKTKGNVFRVTPALGLIREGKMMHITIEFAPKECRRYVSIIEFISSTPGCIIPLFVEGIGSLDQKFYTLAGYPERFVVLNGSLVQLVMEQILYVEKFVFSDARIEKSWKLTLGRFIDDQLGVLDKTLYRYGDIYHLVSQV